MFSFCPHCGGSIGQEQVPGQKLVCRHCGKRIGVIVTLSPVVVDRTQELIRLGTAAPCPLCKQLVELRTTGDARTFVPHQTTTGSRKICPNSGKLVLPSPLQASAAARTSGGKDLRALMTRDAIRVVSCQKDASPRIEELTLEYLDKADRVRIQIEALRDMLGSNFQMKPYPAPLKKTHLAVWGNATVCVIARKHAQGGYQPIADAEIASVLNDIGQYQPLFFP